MELLAYLDDAALTDVAAVVDDLWIVDFADRFPGAPTRRRPGTIDSASSGHVVDVVTMLLLR